MICSLFVILALLDLSTARAIREINDDDNDDNEFLDASDEAQGDLYSRSLRTTEDNDMMPSTKNIRT
ncbi:unnamed protein product [Didymodactylos carnosus]|uniref:Uncharacterized protein n=1 Tax=Didymodactylos carnosus TaxID=1234261 RepID=A0A8S2YRD2_9BILA|nr:unnamed protein product [Didymodactylos carnosus]